MEHVTLKGLPVLITGGTRGLGEASRMGGKSRTIVSSGLTRALRDVARVVEQHEGRAAVIGGVAVIARGVTRLTRDSFT